MSELVIWIKDREGLEPEFSPHSSSMMLMIHIKLTMMSIWEARNLLDEEVIALKIAAAALAPKKSMGVLGT